MMKWLCLSSIAFLIFGFGCGRSTTVDIGKWSKPKEIAKSSDSLSTSFSLHKWNGSLLALGGDAGTFAARVWDEDGKNWKTLSTIDPGWIPMDVDQLENRFVISRALIWSNRLEALFAIGSLSPDGRFMSKTGAPLHLDQAKLFPNGNPNLRMLTWEGTGSALFAGGTMEGREIRIPFRIKATPIERKGRQVGIRADLAISANGLFASSDGGETWRSEVISIRNSQPPVFCRTKMFYYYFAFDGPGGSPLELWSSRCPIDTVSWSAPETLNKTGAHNPSPANLHAIGENDVAHLCWLDGRHEKTRFSLTRPRAGNYEVVYSRREDSKSSWSKDVILSQGLRWAYAPSMSVEGNSVVVAWAGAKSDKEGRNEWSASDIYYVISKDSGNSWTKPTQITDGFKSGITSGRPLIAIHKEVIHLFYVQGKTTYKEASAGMVKLNQPPWPIYYQQRPFQN